MKKAFADPKLELILFGFDVITSSGDVIDNESVDEVIDSDAFDAL